MIYYVGHRHRTNNFYGKQEAFELMPQTSLAEVASTVADEVLGSSSIREAPLTLQHQASVPTASYEDDAEVDTTMVSDDMVGIGGHRFA